MSRAVIDKNLRVKLPEELRHSEGFKPGTEVEMTTSDGMVHIQPVEEQSSPSPDLPPLEWFFGRFPDLDTNLEDWDRGWRDERA